MNGEPEIKTMVDASPSKSFFVEMLTRDIELKDAILDLLDNCLDGVLRTLKEKQSNPDEEYPDFDYNDSVPYKGFYAHIDFNKDSFTIADNCGGMTKETLEKHAFRMGRPALEKDKDLATVGIYGIGMKRAIFKLGKHAIVTTRNRKESYKVEITPEWLANDQEWKLPIYPVDLNHLEKGTKIEVTELRTTVRSEFDTNFNKSFNEDFQTLIATHYSYIIHKGFEVKVNGKTISPKEIYLRFGKEKLSIAPFMFTGKIKNVDVDLVVGLYRNPPTDTEMEEINSGYGNRKENAGWTVIINDRVVLYKDTTHLTGWGEGNVPRYHSQFIAISGVVRFHSNNPEELPLTTTKRGINLNSPLYAEVKNIMREGTKYFTDFTNKWKSDSAERRRIYSETEAVEPLKAFTLVKDSDWSKSVKFAGGKIFKPKLPTPKEEGDSQKNIRFSRPISEINIVAEFLLGNPEASPSSVGEKCFDDYYKLAKDNIN